MLQYDAKEPVKSSKINNSDFSYSISKSEDGKGIKIKLCESNPKLIFIMNIKLRLPSLQIALKLFYYAKIWMK